MGEEADVIARSKDDLASPNGLWAQGYKTWVVAVGSGEIYALGAEGDKTDVQKLSIRGICRTKR